LLLADGGAVLAAAIGGAAWALTGGGKPGPHPGPTPQPTGSGGSPSPVPSPTASRPPGVAPQPVWSHRMEHSGVGGTTPLCVGDVVLLYGVGNVVAVNLQDGGPRWSKPEEGAIGVGAAAGSIAYDGNDLVSVDPSSGGVRWKYTPRTGPGVPARIDASTVLAADEHAVYALCSYRPLTADGEPDLEAKSTPGIFALSRADGSVLWDQHRKDGADTSGVSAVLAGDLLLYTDSQQNLVARSTAHGDQRWFVDTDSHGVYLPVTDGERLYCSAGGGGLQAITLATTKQAWVKSRPPGSKDLWYSAPTVSDGVVYTVLGGTTMTQYGATPSAGPTVIAYAAGDGQELWRLPLPNECSMDASPIVVQDTLFVSTDTQGVYAIDLKAHKLRWIFVNGVSSGVPWQFATDGHLLIAAQDDRVYALPPV
ncbi:PQQ-binding-like beta-propeller repeat protein, partial [Kitasatospora nipponensis]|uniref:outer membrane protein assembly factor BamB family protein n=1 Tax=Kitasatospora nipponensis TaxID=258049 RepID=UPI0031DC15B2